MPWLRRLFFGLLAGLAAMQASAQEADVWQPFAAMALENGYRFTAVQRGGALDVAWRPYMFQTLAASSDIVVTGPEGALTPVPGSAEALLKETAVLFVLLDPSNRDGLFDQLVALRAAFADANFDRQRWEVFLPGDASAPHAVVDAEADLSTAWPKLRALLDARGGPAYQGTLGRHLSALAQRSGDRKAFIVPQSLMPALQPGLNARGIAALQAFGISLYPLTYQLEGTARQAFNLFADSTGGRVLPWLDIPPSSQEAGAVFLPLIAGGTARFEMPPPPWQPWKQPAPLIATLSSDGAPALTMIIPRQASSWADLPWLAISGLALGLLAATIIGILAVTRLTGRPPDVVLVDVLSGRRYPITRWPATVGRGVKAGITIANANLKPEHIRLKAAAGSVELSAVDKAAQDVLVQGQVVTQQVLGTNTNVSIGGVPFRLEFNERA